MAESPTPMRSLERAIDVLEILESTEGPLRLSEIARLAGLPVATTQRILTTLEARDRVERDAYGYRPGVGLAFGAHAYSVSNPLIRTARPILTELAVSTDLTATLFREHRGRRIVLARADTAKNLLGELVVGARLPLHLGAGKALMAHLPEDEMRALLAELAVMPIRPGEAPVPAWEAIRPELKLIRERGYSVSLGERDPGVGSVAAAFHAPGRVEAAVQISGPVDSFRDAARQRELGLQVQQAAFRISRG